MHDAVVISAISGDKKAFETLINIHKEYLYKIAFLYLENKDDALEILDQTILKAYLNISKLKNPEYFKTWITKILINCAKDYLKKNNRISYLEDFEMLKLSYEENHKEIKLDLDSALKDLKSNYRQALTLKYYDNLKIIEISKIMNCSINTIKTYLRRGLKEMKILLKEDYNNEY